MPLITREDVLQMLDQVSDLGNDTYDALLDTICLRVEDTIKLYLNLDFADYAEDTEKVVYGSGTPWLSLPPHENGTVTAVWVEGDTSETEIEGYAEEADGSALYFTGYDPYGYHGWRAVRYVVTANWGLGDWPESVKQVATELAVNIFKERAKGNFTDVIGVDGAGGDVAVAYTGALTKRQKMVLDLTKRKYRPLVVA